MLANKYQEIAVQNMPNVISNFETIFPSHCLTHSVSLSLSGQRRAVSRVRPLEAETRPVWLLLCQGVQGDRSDSPTDKSDGRRPAEGPDCGDCRRVRG